jgi:hypothetical protein
MLPEDNEEKELERKKFAYEIYRKEVEYRRDKAWKIFSWASTIFIGITGGLIALYSKQVMGDGRPENTLLPFESKLLLTGALLVLATYSCLWVHRNTSCRRKVAEKMDNLKLVEKAEGSKIVFGYKFTLILLAVFACFSVWLISK